MSELKIIKGSIQNSILKDGQFVFGEIDCLDTSSGKIYSSSYGAFAHGFVMGDGEIVASGLGSHAEGGAYADSSNKYSERLIASGNYSHAEGYSTTAQGDWSHAEGRGINGYRWVYNGNGPELELQIITIQQLDQDKNSNSSIYDKKIIICPYSVSVNSSIYCYNDQHEIYEYVATVKNCFQFKDKDSSWAKYYVIQTNNDKDLMDVIIEQQNEQQNLSYVTPETFNKYMIHANTGAIGTGSHSEGYGTTAGGYYSHAEGGYTKAFGQYSHAEGRDTSTKGSYSHAEGRDTTAYGDYSHAEGGYTKALVQYSHAEGYSTTAQGDYSHAEGGYTKAFGQYSHAEGYNTIANTSYGLVCGKYNDQSTTGLFVVGDGTASKRSNAFRVNSLGSSDPAPSSVQAKVNGVSNVYLGCPIGTIVMWAGETAPKGWFLCDGSPIPVYGKPGDWKTLECIIQDTSVSDNELRHLAFRVLNGKYGQYQYKKSSEHGWIAAGSYLNNGNEFTVTKWDFDISKAYKFYGLNPSILYQNSSIYDISTYQGISIPNLQCKFPIGANIGGVGKIDNKGTLSLFYSGNERSYEKSIENLKIGQILDLNDAKGLDHSKEYNRYCVIVDFDDKNIGVNDCDEFGKITNKTIKSLFNYFFYINKDHHGLPSSANVSNIKINENEYSTVLGSTGGEETHILSKAEMPKHAHKQYYNLSESTDTSYNPIADQGALKNGKEYWKYPGDNTSVGEPADETCTGGDVAHNNIPPFLAINFIIKYK